MKQIEAFWKESYLYQQNIDDSKIVQIFSVYDSSKRCVRYNSFGPKRIKNLLNENLDLLINDQEHQFLNNNKMPDFIKTNLSNFEALVDLAFDQPHLAYYKKRLKKVLETIKEATYIPAEEIMFFYLYLYNYFLIPRKKGYYLDAFVFQQATQCKNNKVFRFFLKDNKFDCKIYETEDSIEPLLSVENNSQTNAASSEFKNDETCNIYWENIHKWFLDPSSGSDDSSDAQQAPEFIVVLKCFFDAEDIGPSYGVPFCNAGFMIGAMDANNQKNKNGNRPLSGMNKHHEDLSELCWKTYRLLIEKNTDLILSLPLKYPDDPIKDMLEKCCIINDWEKAALLKKEANELSCKYIFKRKDSSCKDCNEDCFEESNESWKKDLQEERWIFCPKASKNDTWLEQLKIKKYLENLKEPITTDHIESKTNGKIRNYYLVSLNFIIDDKILSNIEDEDKSMYSDCFLIFEYPDYTRFPNPNIKLGDYYLRKMIPVIDEIFLKKKSLVANLKASIATIMSRNGSHNIGSHVINRVMEAINTSNVQDHRYFYSYLQHRMDFLAQISTDFSRPASPHWFVKEIMKGFYEQRHLLNYIARSENLKGYDGVDDAGEDEESLKCIIKEVKRFDCDDCDDHSKNDDLRRENKSSLICSVKTGKKNGKFQSPEIAKDLMLAVPGGIIGFHALYTIIENFIRNTAKHCFATHPEQDKDMKVRIEVWNSKADSEYYTIRIWDDYSFVSGGTNLSYGKFDKKDDEFEKILNSYSVICIYNAPHCNKIEHLEGNVNGPQYKLIKNDISNYVQNDSNLVFIVDDGKVFRNNDNLNGIDSDYHRYMQYENVRFIEKAYWDKSFSNVTVFISINELKGLLKRFITPSHHLINQNIMESMVDENERLKKGNWGIGEMRISAGFLAGRSVAEIGGSGTDNLDRLIKAVSIPEYERPTGDNEKGKAIRTKAYRLGYEFRIKKPVDVQVVGYLSHSIEEKEKENAEDQGVFFHDEFNPAVNPKMLVLFDSNKTDDPKDSSADDKENKTRKFIRELKDALAGNGEQKEKREKIKKDIEEFGKFTIFVVHNDSCFNTYSETLIKPGNSEGKKISKRKPCEFDDEFKQFICKRIVFLTEMKFKELIDNNNGEKVDWDKFKINLYLELIDHLKVKVREISASDELLLIFNPTDDTNPTNSGFGYQLSLLCIEQAMKKIIEDDCSQNCMSDREKYLASDIKSLKHKFEHKEVDKNFLKINEYNWRRKLPELFPQLSKQIALPLNDNNNTFFCNYLKNYQEPTKILKDVYGIFDQNYLPQTLPETIRNQSIAILPKHNKDKEENKIIFSGINIINDKKEIGNDGNVANQIFYKRHIREGEKPKPENMLYLESLSGAAPHFPQLCHMPEPSSKSHHYYFYGHLIENALIRIAIADERVCETFLTLRKGLEEACDAGVSFIHNVSGVKLSDSALKCDFAIELESNEGSSAIERITEETKEKLKKSDILIIHQGILDKMTVKTDDFISSLKNIVPFVVITSGRGMPENLPKGVKFIPFSVVENSMLSLPHSKFNLIRQIL